MFAVIVLTMVYIFLGTSVLRLFGITIHDFQAAGGIILLLIGISMVLAKEKQAKISKIEEDGVIEKNDWKTLGIVPLAMPILGGPGTLVFTIMYSQECNTFESKSILVGIVIGLSLLAWIAMLTADIISRYLGKTGQTIISRIMGLIIAAIAVQIIADSIKMIFKI